MENAKKYKILKIYDRKKENIDHQEGGGRLAGQKKILPPSRGGEVAVWPARRKLRKMPKKHKILEIYDRKK